MAEKKEYSQNHIGLTAKAIRIKLLDTLRAGEQITDHQRQFLIYMLQDVENGRSPAAALGITARQGRKIDGNESRNFEIVRTVESLLENDKNFTTGRMAKNGRKNVFEFLATLDYPGLSPSRIERIYYDNRNQYLKNLKLYEKEPDYS